MSTQRGFAPESLIIWCEKAQWSDLTYHRVRRELFDSLQAIDPVSSDGLSVKLPSPIFYSLKSALCSRNQGLSDDKLLAFETAVDELLKMCSNYLRDDVPKLNPPQSGSKMEQH